MIGPPVPIILQPIFKSKPWGGRTLERLFQKSLPQELKIGESWEVADLPGDVTSVRGGPLQGIPLSELLRAWGTDLLGGVAPVNGRFPLLVKFLDAREALSVQVHPRPSTADCEQTPGIKHEAWYVLDVENDATILAGLASGTNEAHFARHAHASAVCDYLQRWTVKPGECYYLPSGTPHALGGGIVVAEVQTPSDITYRLYDWDRVDESGRPRELHVTAALENTRFDVHTNEIRQIASPSSDLRGATRVCDCTRFAIDRLVLGPGGVAHPAPDRLQVVICIVGRWKLVTRRAVLELRPGDCGILPASCAAGSTLTTGLGGTALIAYPR